MQNLVLILFFALSSSVCFAQSAEGKWTSEFALNWGHYPNSGIWGVEYGAGINYHIFNRLGISTQLHSFQGLTPWSLNSNYSVGDPIAWEKERIYDGNYSMTLWNVNVFSDLFVTPKNKRLRLQIGATYFRGASSYVNYKLFEGEYPGGMEGKIQSIKQVIVNQVGMNMRLSYLFNLSDQLYLNVNLAAYAGGEIWISKDPYLDILSIGATVGYRF
jgi:hypothetical protein